MLSFFVILSIFSMVSQNCIFNNICKKELKTNEHLSKFNMFVYGVCIILFGMLLFSEKISLYTVLLGIIFGVVTALSNLYKMLSLSKGPMHITLLITTSSMIIPTVSGIFFGESFSLLKLLAVFILIGFIYLSLDKSSEVKVSKKWFLYCILAFIFQGTVGVLQKVHQNSVHRDEVNVFLCMAFICSFIYSRIGIKGNMKALKLGRKNIILAFVCGLCTFCMNYLNLKLSGMLPSQLFFPLINGSTIILSSLMALIIFKEKLSKKQLVGLIGGICSLIGICLVP